MSATIVVIVIKKEKYKHRIVTLLISVLFLFSISIPAFASGVVIETEVIETEEERIERVYEEVLTGNITNQEDILEVALDQYLASKSDNTNGRSLAEDKPLSIVQTVDVQSDADGNVLEETIACSALVVLNDEGRTVGAVEYSYAHATGTSGSNTYGIYVVHTTYATIRYGDPDDSSNNSEFVRVAKMTTYYVRSSIAYPTKLINYHFASRDVVDLDSISESSTVNSPQPDTNYTFYTTVFWVPRGFTLGSQVQSSVEVYVGNEVITVCNIQRLDPLGNWIFESGW